jgi:exodeoxyribonuclease VII small subunit
MQISTVAVSELNYETAFSELETIVTALESEQPSLQDAMLLFERGQALAKRCAALLDTAELRVRQLTGEGLEDLPAEDADS